MRLALMTVLVLGGSASSALAANHHHKDVVRAEPTPKLVRSRGPHGVTVYLNREGGTIGAGDDDASQNVSSVIDGYADSVKVPAWKGGEKRWGQVVECVKQGFADFNVDVVTERPDGGDYIMMMVGGRPSLVGYGSSVGGVSPYTGEVVPDAVGFVFAAGDDYDLEGVCIGILHEVGHTLGLDHESKCEDPMSYSWDCEKSWQDVDSPCGEDEDSERACGNGDATQNSYRMLAANVGLRSEADQPARDPDEDDQGADDNGVQEPDAGPDVTIADLGDRVRGNGWIEIDVKATSDNGVSDVELGWASEDAQYVFDCNHITDDQPAQCERDGDTWRFALYVGTGVRAMAARATDGDGNQTVTDARVLQLVEPRRRPNRK
jgi:hypothetical protein